MDNWKKKVNQNITRCGLICLGWMETIKKRKEEEEVWEQSSLCEPEHVKHHLIGMYASRVEV